MNAVILDNWTFQTIGELFANGLDKRRTQALVVKGRQHTFKKWPDLKYSMTRFNEELRTSAREDFQ